jgi:hypothetical protein
MGNLDSILNGVGLLMVGGFFKRKNIMRLVTSSTSVNQVAVQKQNRDGSWNYESEAPNTGVSSSSGTNVSS